MNHLSIPGRLGCRIILAAILAAAILGPARSSIADMTLTSSMGSASFAVYDTTEGTFLPVFNADGSLQSPGSGLPSLYQPSEGLPMQTAGLGSLVPSFTASSRTTNPNNPTNVVPIEFGTAATQIFASGTGQGVILPQGGVLWSTKTSLSDRLINPGQASVSISMASATFLNTTGSTETITPGALLNVLGTIGGSADSFVAVGLSTSYMLSGSNTPVALSSIVLAGQGNEGFYSIGNVTGDSGTAGFNNGVFRATGTSFASGVVQLANNESITVMGVLTLISDPCSTIGIAEGVAPGFTGLVPTFGISANAIQPVPEPSAVALLGSGLAASGLWVLSRRRRPRRCLDRPQDAKNRA